MADTLVAQISATTVQIIAATIALMPQKAPMMNLVVRKTIPKGHNQLLIPRVNSTSTVQKPTEGDELVTSSQISLTSTTISPTIRAIMVRISERATYFSRDDIVAYVAEEMAQSQAQDIDTDLTSDFTSFGQSTGSTGVDLTLATARTSRQLLYANTRANGGPAPAPVFMVIPPLVEERLFTNLGLQGVVSSTAPWIMNGLSEELIQNYYIPQGQLLGVQMFRDGYMTVNGSSDFICGMFSSQAIWLAVSKDWDMKTFEVPNWIGPVIRSVADYASGIGAYSNWGVKVTAKGT